EISILACMAPTSPRVSHSGLPVSRAMLCASSSAWVLTNSPKRRTSASRSAKGRVDQAGNAAPAAVTAAATWPAVAIKPCSRGSPVAGSVLASNAPSPARQRPPINRLSFAELIVSPAHVAKSNGRNHCLPIMRSCGAYPNRSAGRDLQQLGFGGADGRRRVGLIDDCRGKHAAKIGMPGRGQHAWSGRCAGVRDAHAEPAAVLDSLNVVDVGFQCRPGVEDVDVVLV